MMINNSIPSVLKAYVDNKTVKNPVKEKTVATGGSEKKDEIILSVQAQSFSQLLQKAKNNTGVRQDKVDDIVQKIGDGHYQSDARLIAEKMLATRY